MRRRGGAKEIGRGLALLALTGLLFTSSAQGAPADLDPAFGDRGKVTTGFGEMPSSGTVWATATRRDGKIVALQESLFQGAILARYRTNGKLDRRFGRAGRVRLPFHDPSATLFFNGLTLEQNGRIVVVGPLGSALGVARYRADGRIDRTLGGDGTVKIPVGQRTTFSVVAASQPDGRIVIAPGGGLVLRLKPGGQLDGSFSDDGIARVPFAVRALGIQRNGKIVAAGTQCRSSCFSVARLNPNGGRDRDWSGDGISTTVPYRPTGRSGSSGVRDLAIQRDGRVVVVGARRDARQPLGRSATWATALRYTINGKLDSSFGGDGIATTAPAGVHASSSAVALQRDGRIVIAGSIFDSGATALMRFTRHGRHDRRFGERGVADYSVPTAPTPAEVALGRDGTIVTTGGTSVLGSYGLGVMHVRPSGDLDRRFSGDGIAFTRPKEQGFDTVHGLAIQSDGKVVAVGASSRECVGSTESIFCPAFAALARYLPDGSLDESFGQRGLVRTTLGEGVYPTPVRGQALIVGLGAAAVAVQGDGKIVVAGAGGLARYNPDGSLDQSFGTDGISRRDGALWLAVSVQPDGRIVVAGDEELVRYNPDGSLDESFGTGGVSTRPETTWTALMVQDDGRIVVTGSRVVSCGLYSCETEATLARYNPDGSADPTFGSGGAVTDTDGSRPTWRALSIQPDGKIVAAGSEYPGSTIARYEPDGTPDATFGTGGVARDEGVDWSALALQADGRILVAGTIFDYPRPSRLTLTRYDSTGAIDPTFGKRVILFGSGSGAAQAVAVQADDRIVVGGQGENDFALARLIGG
jgi:uncharacterized delta-60 repeat protein